MKKAMKKLSAIILVLTLLIGTINANTVVFAEEGTSGEATAVLTVAEALLLEHGTEATIEGYIVSGLNSIYGIKVADQVGGEETINIKLPSDARATFNPSEGQNPEALDKKVTITGIRDSYCGGEALKEVSNIAFVGDNVPTDPEEPEEPAIDVNSVLTVVDALQVAHGTEITLEGYIVEGLNTIYGVKVADEIGNEEVINIQLPSDARATFNPSEGQNPDALNKKVTITGTRDSYMGGEALKSVTNIEFVTEPADPDPEDPDPVDPDPVDPTVITIAEAKTKTIGSTEDDTVGDTVTVQGIITVLNARFFIQEVNGDGINLYESGKDLSALNVGDEVKVTGSLVDHKGLLELSPYTIDEVVSTGNTLPAEQLVTPDTFDETTHEAELVYVENVVILEKASYGNYIAADVNDTSKTIQIDPQDSSLDSYFEVGKVFTEIHGVANVHYNELEIMPIDASSFVEDTSGVDPVDPGNGEYPEITDPTDLVAYYDGIDGLTGNALKAALNDIITEGHDPVSYRTAYSALADTDIDPDNTENVILFYKNVSVNGDARQSDNGDIWNREHVWAKSHGDFETRDGAGTDLHQLRPTDASVNSSRGNLNFDESDNPLPEAPENFYDSDSFEPRDEVKGDVARIIFYMATRYEGEDSYGPDLELTNDVYTGNNEPLHGKLSTLLAWHEADPVSDAEIYRNSIAEDYQGNRNPYIDHPEFVALIWNENGLIDGDDGNDGNDGGTTEPALSTLAEVRLAADDTKVATTGIVTAVDGRVFIQDTTAGINLKYDGTAPAIAIGDEVKVVGTKGTSYGLENIMIDTITVLSSDNTLPDAQVITASMLSDEYEAEIVTIKDITVTGADKYWNYNGSDATGDFLIDPKDSNSNDWIEAGTYTSITGVIMYEFSEFELMPVKVEDIVKGEVVDNAAPVISVLSPATTTDKEVSTIVVKITDDSTIAETTFTVDGTLYTGDVTWTGDSASITLDSPLALGDHVLAVTAKDEFDNASDLTYNFTIEEETVFDGTYDHYYGQLHAHSTYSDGQGTGDEAYTQARYEGNADFFALTDHSNWFDHEDDSQDITSVADSTSEDWKNLNADADEHYVPGEFVAIAGFEMTWSGSTGGWGHINTFNTPWFISRDTGSHDLPTYYEKISQPENASSVNQLNHPGKTFGDFADFGFYSEAADAVVNLVEVGNGEGPIRGAGYYPSYEYYTRALDKGWHVAPSNNQDNHKGNFIISNEARTVVLGEELTREGIFDGISNLRVYSTEDSNLEVNYFVNGEIMGSQLDNPTSLDFDIDVVDTEGDNIEKITIIADGGYEVISKEFNTNVVEWNFTLEPQFAYYYVRVDQADQDIAVTAPVWTADVVPVGISKVEASENPTLVGSEIEIAATVYNNGTEIIEGQTTVEFYLDEVKAENLITSVAVDGIGAGATDEAKFNWTPDSNGMKTIYAKTTIAVDGVDKVFTNSVQVQVYSEDEAQIILVDGGHQNLYVSGSYAGRYEGLKEMMGNKSIILRLNEDEITAEDFENVSALIITDPASTDSTKYGYTKAKFSDAELQVVADFVNAGGNLILTSTADYKDATDEYQSSIQGNSVLEAIGSNLRVNDDQAIDNENNDGSSYKFLLDQFTGTKFDVFDTVQANPYRVYSGCTVILKENGDDTNVDWLVKGHATTETSDADGAGDNTPVAKGNVYMLAAEVLPSGGKVVVAGSTFFSDFEISGDNMFANTDITESILEWVAPKKEAELVKIAELKLDADNDGVLDLYGKRYAVEGYVTAESEKTSELNGRKNAFFEVIYVQDETGGITVFGVSATDLPIGTKVRIEGIVEQYNGDGELSLTNELEEVTVLDAPPVVYEPTVLSTADVMLESNEGLLVKTSGVVTSMTENSIFINDGSGEARVYVNGYIGDGSGNKDTLGKWDPNIEVGNTISVIGMASEDEEGHRIRVRNTAEIVLETLEEVETVALSIDESMIYRKDANNITVKVALKDIEDINAIDAIFTYNPEVLQYKGAVKGDLVKVYVDKKAGTLHVVGAYLEPITSDEEIILELNFKAVKADVNPEVAVGVVELTKMEIVMAAAQQLVVPVVECGKVEVEIINNQFDVNLNGEVNVVDLSFATLNFYAEATDDNWESVKYADVNMDGIIDVLDLTMIMKQVGKQK